MTSSERTKSEKGSKKSNPGKDSHLDDEDDKIIDGAERALKAGVELKEWWERAEKEGTLEDRFKEASVYRRPDDNSFGFFETADLPSGETKVIGNVQQQLYYRPKGADAESVRRQIREFVLRYFMRISVYRTPQPEAEGPDEPGPLKGLSQFPTEDDYQLQGFGYSQRYYKKKGSNNVRIFKEADQNKILDLRELQRNYKWLLVRNPIVDFEVNVRPLGVGGPDLTLPVPKAANWLVMSPDTITIEDDPGKGLIGRYGIGYAFMKDPDKPDLFAYGPGQLEPTIQTLIWEVHNNGDVIVRMYFVSGAPTAILSLSVNPLDWGFVATDLFTAGKFSSYLAPFRRAANKVPFSSRRFDPVYPALRALNFLTMGAAENQLGVSREQLNKTLTYTHFMQHYHAVLGSRQTWEQFPDWTDEKSLPNWVISGESA